jgi:hypothetical protein
VGVAKLTTKIKIEITIEIKINKDIYWRLKLTKSLHYISTVCVYN